MLRLHATAPLTLALLATCPAWGQPGLERKVLAMGTVLALHLEGGDQARLQAGAEAALAEVGRIEAACSTWRPESAWSRLNAAEGRAVALDREWIDLLEAAKRWTARTGGAFDPCLRPLMEAWDVRGRGRVPGAGERALALRESGAEHLVLDREAGTARLEGRHAGVEEGGFVKGYALDRALAAAREAGARTGWFDFGGQVLVAGERVVPVARPGPRDRLALTVRLRDASLATSGTSERGRHILDPRTGRPCPAWGSVSVVAPTAFEADVLSTALYVMGPTQGLAWAEARGLPACFLHTHGRRRMTDAFAALLVP
ncbi:MAG: FAD:protein FMN transferase [Holophagaceae bacterium]